MQTPQYYTLSLHDALPISVTTNPATWTSATVATAREVRTPRRFKNRKYRAAGPMPAGARSEEHTSELQSRGHLVCRLLLDKKKIIFINFYNDIVQLMFD